MEIEWASNASPLTSAQKVSEAALNHTVDVRAKVNLADIVVLQDSGVSGVGSVVGSTMVQGAAGGEGQACVQLVLLYQLTRTVLQPLTAGAMRDEMRRMKWNKNSAPTVDCVDEEAK